MLGGVFWQSFTAACISLWCPGPESNRHASRRGILSPLRLPVSPPGPGILRLAPKVSIQTGTEHSASFKCPELLKSDRCTRRPDMLKHERRRRKNGIMAERHPTGKRPVRRGCVRRSHPRQSDCHGPGAPLRRRHPSPLAALHAAGSTPRCRQHSTLQAAPHAASSPPSLRPSCSDRQTSHP
jgi:hypothetical protein